MVLEFITSRLQIRTFNQNDVSAYQKYLIENRNFLEPWEPSRDESFFTEKKVEEMIVTQNEEELYGRGFYFLIELKSTLEIIGTIGISNIVYGPFLSCFLGYKLCESQINNGYMTEALKSVLDFAFNKLELHRIEANVMPRNKSSIKVLKKLGFEREGLSKKYIKINGIWEDHEHYVLLNDIVE